jgi:hypothetical protein
MSYVYAIGGLVKRSSVFGLTSLKYPRPHRSAIFWRRICCSQPTFIERHSVAIAVATEAVGEATGPARHVAGRACRGSVRRQAGRAARAVAGTFPPSFAGIEGRGHRRSSGQSRSFPTSRPGCRRWSPAPPGGSSAVAAGSCRPSAAAAARLLNRGGRVNPCSLAEGERRRRGWDTACRRWRP